MAKYSMTSTKIGGGGKSAGKSPVRSGGSVGTTKPTQRQAQRTVAPAKGYGQSATGRNSTAGKRAAGSYVGTTANRAAIADKYAKSMTQGSAGAVVTAMNRSSGSSGSQSVSNFRGEANRASQSMVNSRTKSAPTSNFSAEANKASRSMTKKKRRVD